MKRKIKLGIIGTGIAAKKLHLPALQKLSEEFEITAVCNHTEPKAKEFASMAGNVPYYLNYKKLLKDKNVEAVDIVLPISLNYKVTKDALKAGKHVILEKPISSNLADAKKMLKLETKYDPVVMIAENYRYRKIYKKAKEIIESGRIGKAYAAQWNIFYHNREDVEFGATKWRQQHEHPGGFISDGGVHNITTLRYFFGNAKAISSLTKSVNPAVGSCDTMNSIIKFDSGVNVNLNLFYSAVSHTENRILIFCEKGTIEISDFVLQVKHSDGSVDSEDFGNDTGFQEEFLTFYYAITSDAKIPYSFAEGYKDFELIVELLNAAEKERVVKF